MRLDLHCHSRLSDGTLPPAEVAALAGDVELFCLTDHDTCAGFEETVRPGVRTLRGMELSCRAEGRNVHLLLLGIAAEGPGRARLDELLAGQQERRRARVHEICARFLRWNIRLDPEAILRAAGGTPGRPHIAAALVAARVCRSVPEAFDRFLKDGGPADVPAEHLDPAVGVEIGRGAGACVSLAHPHTTGAPAFVRALVLRLQPLGLGGIEAFYGPASRRTSQDWVSYAASRGLVATAGSDFHGPTVVPAITSPGVTLDEPHAARLLEWLGDR
jgi:hypothetical protein